MAVWLHTLKLGDIFHDENMSFPAKRDEIVDRIRKASFYDEDDSELNDLIWDLDTADDLEEFDFVWNHFYDWCDRERVWLETF